MLKPLNGGQAAGVAKDRVAEARNRGRHSETPYRQDTRRHVIA